MSYRDPREDGIHDMGTATLAVLALCGALLFALAIAVSRM